MASSDEPKAKADEDRPDIDELLALVTGSGDIHEQMKAIAQLGKLRVASAAPVLIDVLSSSDDWLRIEAAKALRQIADPRAVPALLEALRADFGEQYARLVVERQAHIQEDRLAHAAVAAVQDLLDQEELQREAARALVAIGDIEAESGLAALLAELRSATEYGFTGANLIEAVTESLARLRKPVN